MYWGEHAPNSVSFLKFFLFFPAIDTKSALDANLTRYYGKRIIAYVMDFSIMHKLSKLLSILSIEWDENETTANHAKTRIARFLWRPCMRVYVFLVFRPNLFTRS